MQDLHQPADAEKAYRKAADEYARLAAAAPNDGKAAADVAITWVSLGDLARSSGQANAAIEWYDKAIARLAGKPGDGALCDAHVGRAESLTVLGKLPEARRMDHGSRPRCRAQARIAVATGEDFGSRRRTRSGCRGGP